MIPVAVDQLFYAQQNAFVVLLKGLSDERSLPIFIGQAEAQAIMLHMKRVEVPRPLTHDLMKNILERLGWRIIRVEVCDLIDGTFYAKLILSRGEQETIEIDSRPSDAVALALRQNTPIFVAEKVMDEAGQVIQAPASGDGQTGGKKKDLDKLSPLEAMNRDMEKAVAEERYEDAARIRDQMKRIKNTTAEN